jgi:hypothetical protein
MPILQLLSEVGAEQWRRHGLTVEVTVLVGDY